MCKSSVTEQQYKEAEKLLIQYANDMNANPPRAHAGDSRPDISKAQEIVKQWGWETEYRWENGRQVLYIGGVPRN
jgi:hypothetical protein